MDVLPLIGPASLYYSYGQFLAFDSAEEDPGSLWTSDHFDQGFVRRPRSVSVRTLAQDGDGWITVFRGRPTSIDAYERVISVPIELPSGILCLEGPEEYPLERSVNLGPGAFHLLFCQELTADEALRIDLYIEAVSEAVPHSRVLKADDGLSTRGELIETGDVAG